MGIAAEQGLTLFGGDATDTYAYSPAPYGNILLLMILMLIGTN